MTVIINSGATETDVINVLFENIFENGTFTFTSQAPGFSASNVLDDSTYNGWKPTAVPGIITINAGAPVTCDAIGIAAHDMGTNNSAFALQHSPDGITWTTVILNYSPENNDDIFAFFPAVTRQYWRFIINFFVATVGVVKLGKKLSFPCAPISGHVALHHARKYELLSNASMNGQFFSSRVVRIGAETSVNVGQVDRDFAEADLAAFELHYNQGGAFFYCGAPSDIPKDMGYCKRPDGSQEMGVTWVEGDTLAEVSFDVSGYVPT